MDASFWHNRWQTNQTGWHECAVNPLLITHFPSLNVPPGGRVFVPFCGKSLDLGWLLSRGYAVAGAELSELAVTQLFAELGVEARISEVGKHRLFRGEKIDIYVGDLFDLSRDAWSRGGSTTGPRWSRYLRPCGPIHNPAQSPHGSGTSTCHCCEYDQASCQGLRFPSPTNSIAITATAILRAAGPCGRPWRTEGQCPATEHIWRLENYQANSLVNLTNRREDNLEIASHS